MLAKADLISDMVFEFTDLQGIIGKYYAKAHGESEIVADAIEQQYWPKYSGADLPKTDVANCVALAEKLDTLVGIFGVGQNQLVIKTHLHCVDLRLVYCVYCVILMSMHH